MLCVARARARARALANLHCIPRLAWLATGLGSNQGQRFIVEKLKGYTISLQSADQLEQEIATGLTPPVRSEHLTLKKHAPSSSGNISDL